MYSVMEIMMGLIIVFWLRRKVVRFAIITMLYMALNSRVNVSDAFVSVMLTFSVVVTPNEMVIDICFEVVAIKILKLFGVVVFKFEDIVDGMMWHIVVAMVFIEVMVWVTTVALRMVIVKTMVIVMVIIEILMVSIMVVLSSR